MARKPNYGYEKRKKELERKAKKEEKRRRRRENAAERAPDQIQPALDVENAGETAGEAVGGREEAGERAE